VILANSAQLGGHVEIGRNAIIGGLTAVHQFCHIGPFVMLSGATGTNKDIPPFVKAGHFPAHFAGVNIIGLRRNGFSREAIDRISDCYKIIYHTGRNVTQAVEFIEANVEMHPEIETILAFIKASPRGIIRAARSIDIDD
jgi:UDP-N-acetylglucosamine acyltransferase